MRVLMISDVYFPRINGVSTSIETFRSCLDGHGVDLQLVAPDYGAADGHDWIARVPSRPVPRDPEDRLMSYRKALGCAEALHAAKPFDLVHIQTPFVAHYAGAALARRWRRPSVVTYHTLFEEYLGHYVPVVPAGWLRGLARRFSRTQCNDADAVIVPSSAMAERLGAYGVRTPLRVLPTGIPLERFTSGDGATFRRRHGIGPERRVALYVGRVSHEKNIGFLLEAADRVRRVLPELVLVIAGEGPAAAALKHQAARLDLGDHVRFVGYLDRRVELPGCYAAADAFAFASRTETQGLVLLEAMAMGLPVVALAEMGTRDILRDCAGAVTPHREVADFAAGLTAVLRDPTAREQLGKAAAVHAGRWSDREMAARLAGLYAELIAAPRT